MVFLSDSLSALQSLQSTPAEKRTRQLRESFENLASTSTVTLQWIPAHCGIKGNENADRLAKEGGKQEQPETSMTFKESVFLSEGSCPQRSFWSTLMIYLNYSVHTSTVPYTQMIWQYGLGRKLLVQNKPECRMPSAKWNSGQRTRVSPSMIVKQPQCFSLYRPSQSSSDLR